MRLTSLLNLALAATLLCSAVPATAQSPAPSPAAASHSGAQVDRGIHIRKVLAKLTLSADQKAKVQTILDDQSLKGVARRDAVLKVLTPEQQVQFKSLMARHHSAIPSPTPAR